MTNEAAKYNIEAIDWCHLCTVQDSCDGVDHIYCEDLKNTIIEALEKAEKYKWHDLRKNPNDLPYNDTSVFIHTIGGYETFTCFNYDHFGVDEVIAWKYREPFEEVEE